MAKNINQLERRSKRKQRQHDISGKKSGHDQWCQDQANKVKNNSTNHRAISVVITTITFKEEIERVFNQTKPGPIFNSQGFQEMDSLNKMDQAFFSNMEKDTLYTWTKAPNHKWTIWIYSEKIKSVDKELWLNTWMNIPG